MATLAELLQTDTLKSGSQGWLVVRVQAALSNAGYRIVADGKFGPATTAIVKRFQLAHRLEPDGIVGEDTAAKLDIPHTELIATALPISAPAGSKLWPHDDTASLKAFYGDPEVGLEHWQADNVVHVIPPFQMTYAGKPIDHIAFHSKAADALLTALTSIWEAAGKDQSSPILKHVSKFSGSGNFRPIRGSSRLSCHAFWAAIDFDAEHLPLGKKIDSAEMPQVVVDAFIASGAFWGGNYISRKDPMHFQYAHE